MNELRTTRAGSQTAVGGAFAWLVAVASLVFGGACGPGEEEPPVAECPVDRDLCPLNCAIPGQALVLLDPSDPIDPVPQVDVRNKLAGEADALDTHTELRVYDVGDIGRGRMVPLFQMCVPVHPDSTHNPDLFRRNYRRFHTAFDSAISRVFGEGGDTISLILEAIQAAEVEASRRRVAEWRNARHMIVVSDMVQHSQDVSFYGGELPAFGETPDHLYADLEDMTGMTFRLRRREYPGQIQAQPEFHAFWAEYFTEMGATMDTSSVIGGSSGGE